MEIVIASQNPHKIRELRALLRDVQQIDWLSLHHFPSYVPPEETGTTFEENARLKAEHAAKALGRWVIADDSGLVVPILQGAPGVYSRRYAGADASDKENRIKLLQELKGKSGIERSAYFECVLAAYHPSGQGKIFKGLCEGFLLDEERGGNGFGYDPLFVKHDYHQTFAQLDETTKNRISHRRKAFDQLTPYLRSILPEE